MDASIMSGSPIKTVQNGIFAGVTGIRRVKNPIQY
jgi:hypothetical protein